MVHDHRYNMTRRNFGKSMLAAAWGGAFASTFSGRAYSAGQNDIRIAYGAIGANRHPHYLTNVPDCDIVNTIFDPLITRTNDGKIVPVLAETFGWQGGKYIKMTLRKNAAFSDGTSVRAEDVKFSLENYLKSPNRYMYADWLDHVDVIDDHTVHIIAKSPSRVALPNMAYMSHIIPHTATDAAAFAAKPVGSGPYQIVKVIPNDRIILQPNPYFWGGKPAFSNMTFRQIVENSTRLSALAAREIDFAAAVPVDDIDWVKKSASVYENLSARMMFLRFNFLADSPLKDVRVRRAFNHAVDRDAIRKGLLNGLGASLTGPVPSNVAFGDVKLPPYNYDPDLAKKMLKDAGYGNGFSMPLVTTNGRYVKDREIAEAVAGQFEQINVNVQIVPMEWPTFIQQISTERKTTGRKYPMHLFAWGNLTGDIDFSLAAFDANNVWNMGSYKNEKLQKLIHEGQQELDPKKAKDIYDQAQKVIWDDAPFLFLFTLPTINAGASRIKGYVGRADEQIFWRDISFA